MLFVDSGQGYYRHGVMRYAAVADGRCSGQDKWGLVSWTVSGDSLPLFIPPAYGPALCGANRLPASACSRAINRSSPGGRPVRPCRRMDFRSGPYAGPTPFDLWSAWNLILYPEMGVPSRLNGVFVAFFIRYSTGWAGPTRSGGGCVGAGAICVAVKYSRQGAKNAKDFRLRECIPQKDASETAIGERR